MEAYKVFYRWQGMLQSINGVQDFTITYQPGERASAPGGTKLFVFDTLENALIFTKDFWSVGENRMEVWLVRCSEDIATLEGSTPMPMQGSDFSIFWGTFFRNYKGSLSHIVIQQEDIREISEDDRWRLFSVTPGTMLCDWVVPQMRVG